MKTKLFVIAFVAVVCLLAKPEAASAQACPMGMQFTPTHGCISQWQAYQIVAERNQCRMSGLDPVSCNQVANPAGQMGIYNPYGWQTYGGLLQYPYSPYQGYYGRIVQSAGGNPYFDAMIVPCQIAGKGQRIARGAGITALGMIAGWAIGEGSGHPGKGALIGAAGGAGAAFLNDSRYCSAPRQTHLPVQQTGQMYQQPEAAPIQNQIQTTVQPMAVTPANPLAGITWSTVNTTDSIAVLTDPNLPEDHPKRKRIIPVKGSMRLPTPSGEQPYVVDLLSPGFGNIDSESGLIRPSCDLQGWDIVARDDVGTPACQ